MVIESVNPIDFGSAEVEFGQVRRIKSVIDIPEDLYKLFLIIYSAKNSEVRNLIGNFAKNPNTYIKYIDRYFFCVSTFDLLLNVVFFVTILYASIYYDSFSVFLLYIFFRIVVDFFVMVQLQILGFWILFVQFIVCLPGAFIFSDIVFSIPNYWMLVTPFLLIFSMIRSAKLWINS